VKRYTAEQEKAQAKQERETIPEGSPVAGMLLDYPTLRAEVAAYCK
jgi:hypothetical protein